VVTDRHIAATLDELLVSGGVLTLRLLGGKPPSERGPVTVPPGTARFSLKPVRGTVRCPACRVESRA
jgi:hypothetical protein